MHACQRRPPGIHGGFASVLSISCFDALPKLVRTRLGYVRLAQVRPERLARREKDGDGSCTEPTSFVAFQERIQARELSATSRQRPRPILTSVTLRG